MEIILTIIAIVIGWAIFSWLVSAGTRTLSAAGKALLGKGSFSENIELEFKGMSSFEVRLTDTRLGENNDGPLAKAIEARGLFPIVHPAKVAFVTSVLDKHKEKYEPIISTIEALQEPHSVVYQYTSDVGQVSPEQGYLRWARVGIVIPEILVPPTSAYAKSWCSFG